MEDFSMIIILAAIVLVLSIAFFLMNQSKKRKQKKELKMLAEDKYREEILIHNITNSKNEKDFRQTTSTPYKIEYSRKTSDKQKLSDERFSGIMLQIVEDRDLSIRKYMLNPDHKILIGKSYTENAISVAEAIADIGQCEIYTENRKVLIRDPHSSNATILQRGRKMSTLTSEPFPLITGDKVIIGNVIFTISII